MNGQIARAEMGRAFRNRDASYDGAFFAAVRTTGIFCKPSCPARRPLDRNTEYFQVSDQALRAGYRPCKRCKPLEKSHEHPDWVTRILRVLENDESPRLRDRDLNALNANPVQARRYFQRRFGMTFQSYARTVRLRRAQAELRNGASIDDAVFNSGYESHSGFREAFGKLFQKTPKNSPSHAMTVSWFPSPVGDLIVGATNNGIALLEFAGTRAVTKQFEAIRKRTKLALVPGMNSHLAQVQTELNEYFSGRRTDFGVPLDFCGTPFQEKVWKALLKIPYGETRSYQDIARAVKSPGAVRAVGSANGANRIAIVIPCHRVVQKGGAIGGYGGEVWRKRFLLELEKPNP